MLLYTFLIIGAVAVLGFGLPLMERLLRRVKPLTPRQEEAEQFRQQARLSLDRFPR